MVKIAIKSVALASLFVSLNIHAFASDLTNDEVLKLIDIAGKQRMLSQRIVKDYLYVGKDVVKDKAEKELKYSLDEFKNGKKYILSISNDKEIINLVSFIDMSLTEFIDLLNEDFDVDNAKIAMDLSESILEGSQFIVNNLEKKYGSNPNNVINIARKQRMLSQRIAKYYIAYQNGVKDANTVKQIHNAVKEFAINHKILLENKNNTDKINRKLREVGNLWSVVYKFYNNIEEGGLPFIVFTSTDKITKKMDNIVQEYTKLKEGEKK